MGWDKSQDGKLSRVEVLNALKRDEKMQQLFGVDKVAPGFLDDAVMASFDASFRAVDIDGSDDFSAEEIFRALSDVRKRLAQTNDTDIAPAQPHSRGPSLAPPAQPQKQPPASVS